MIFNSLRPSDAYNGLSTVRRQPIIWSDGGILSLKFQGTYFNKMLFEIKKIIQENAYENVVCTIGGHLVSASMC